jgi:hypothetical protein
VVGALLAAVLLLTGLTLLNLALVFGVIRRLREHESRLSQLVNGQPAVMRVQPGSRVPTVTTRSVAGAELTIPDGRPALLGFFSPDCDACHERLPDFLAAATGYPGSVTAVVVSAGGDDAALVAPLSSVAGVTVVVEEPGGPAAAALGVQGFPAFAQLDADGVLRFQGFELPVPA